MRLIDADALVKRLEKVMNITQKQAERKFYFSVISEL